jgi:hypothetical protein
MRCSIRWDTGYAARAGLTDDAAQHSRGAKAPEWCIVVASLKAEAQGRPGAACTRSLVCSGESTRVRTTGSTGHPAFPCTMVYGLSRALPGVPLFDSHILEP